MKLINTINWWKVACMRFCDRSFGGDVNFNSYAWEKTIPRDTLF